MDISEFEEFAAQWGVTLPEAGVWTDLLPIIERVCVENRGYFVLKVDGERSTRMYTVALNLPYPSDLVVRKDTDNIEDGVAAVLQELRTAGLRPKNEM